MQQLELFKKILYRPVGLSELKLIEESGWKKFPPRLPEQAIFYPVCSREYAQKNCLKNGFLRVGTNSKTQR